MAAGLCDNLAVSLLFVMKTKSRLLQGQTSFLRALSPAIPTYIFPAMNTHMYEHPLTAEHLRIVKDVLKYRVEGPISKGLACGDSGVGAMTEWKDVVDMVVRHFNLQKKVEA